MRTFKLYSLGNFQISATVLLTMITMLQIDSITYLFYNWKFVQKECVVCLFVSFCLIGKVIFQSYISQNLRPFFVLCYPKLFYAKFWHLSYCSF